MSNHTDTSKDYFTRYALASLELAKDKAAAEHALTAIDIVDRLCVMNEFAPDSSTRHNLAHARAWINEIAKRNAPQTSGEQP